MSGALQAAQGYVARGWNPLPLPFKSKIPADTGWQKRVIGEQDLPRYFNGKPQNVGVVLGPTSIGLTDVDLDCREAIELAPCVLPKTGAIFGRNSAPASHWLYYSKLAATSEDEKATIPFKDPTRPAGEAMLLEVRVGGDKGAQTVFPGSVHETDEEIRWDESGDPAKVDNDDLLKRARLLASICLLARYWPGSGARHDAALSLGGFLARAGLKAPQVKYLVVAIARTAKDPEHQDRKNTAEDAAQAFHAGKPARGFPLLTKTFGPAVAKQIAEWLDYRGSTSDDGTGGTGNKSPLSNDIVTEQSAAQLFAEEHGDQFRYCRSAKQWFFWNGVIWTRDERGVAYHWAGQLSSRLGEDQNAATRKNLGRAAFANGVEKFAQHDPRLVMTADGWNTDPMLLGTPGGTVDLQTGELRTSRREDCITKMTGVAPLDEPCPRWIQFLNEATGWDAGLIKFLQQWCGYGLTGLTREHALVFVYGPGGNGKSVFLNVVQTIMKDYAITAAMDTFTASNSDKHPTDLAMLCGARLVTASETEEGRAWAEARIKQMTGGDRITAHFTRQDNFTFTPQFKLTIAGNHRPVLHNVDEAARRRFNIVPFLLKPNKPDRELEAKLMCEAGGILK
jgi:putative DNA primase/helicase